MKKLLFIIAIGLISLPMLFLSGCNTTKVISSWKAPNASLRSYNKILVIGLMDAKERGLREQIENKLVGTFASAGISAGSSYSEYGPKAFSGLTEEQALKNIEDSGYDGAFIVVLLDKSKERTYNPGYMYYTPYYGYYGRFWPYYSTLYGRIWEPGYYTTSTNYIIEANFYDLKKDELEYSAQTKSFNTSSSSSLASELSEKLLQDMMNENIIQK
jgi:hypothetical protein